MMTATCQDEWVWKLYTVKVKLYVIEIGSGGSSIKSLYLSKTTNTIIVKTLRYK